MEFFLDYQNAVDILDEGIMALNLYRDNVEFPESLRCEVKEVLNFLKLADKPEYKDLLYDKRITITKERLDFIHSKIKDLKFPIADIEVAIDLLSKTSSINGITSNEISQLEKYLLEFSHPLWVSSISKRTNGK